MDEGLGPVQQMKINRKKADIVRQGLRAVNAPSQMGADETQVLAVGNEDLDLETTEMIEFGYAAVEKRVSVPDLHATILHLLGMDHHALTYSRNGLDERLTGVYESRIVDEILA